MLIVGLGNPGTAHALTRHNIGWRVIDHLVQRLGARSIVKSSFEGELFTHDAHYYLKPTTYMNLSGRSILAVKQFYKIEEVIVIHDDLDLPFGALRIKRGGGHGGHNGLKSTDSTIGKEYIRLRMGIGKPVHKGEVASYVLSPFSEQEESHIALWITAATAAIEALLDHQSCDVVASKYSRKGV